MGFSIGRVKDDMVKGVLNLKGEVAS